MGDAGFHEVCTGSKPCSEIHATWVRISETDFEYDHRRCATEHEHEHEG